MATHNSEQISALLDGELAYGESSSLLDGLLQESGEKERLARYQMYSACLRRESLTLDHAALFDNIHTSIAAEPAILAPAAIKSKPAQGFRRFATGGAIAAGVAAVILIGANQLPTGQQLPTVADNATPTAPVALMAPVAVAEHSADSLSERNADLNAYLQEHENMLSDGSLGSGLPFATMVGYGGL